MKRSFEDVMNSLKKSIIPADFFVDFSKVYINIKEYEVHLNILNTLIGKDNIEEEFVNLVSQYPEILKSIPILLATHEKKFNIVSVPTIELLDYIENKNYKVFEDRFICYDFTNVDRTLEEYASFCRQCGLFDLLENRKIKNLVDYALGIEVGLDSNGRKNRTGKIMEKIVEKFLKNANIDYQPQMKYSEIDKLYNTNFCSIGKATKRFDYVFKSKITNELIVMEVNYYNTQGSKPNETAKSYIELNNQVKNIDGVKFVWITDGFGWHKSRPNLEDAYDSIEHLYTIKDLEDGILEKI